jgi:hypothetical protein
MCRIGRLSDRLWYLADLIISEVKLCEIG